MRLWLRFVLSFACLGVLVPSLQAWHLFHRHHAQTYAPVYGVPVQTFSYAAPVQRYTVGATIHSFAVPTTFQSFSYTVPATSYMVVPSSVDTRTASAESVLDTLSRSRDILNLLCKATGSGGGGGVSSDLDSRLSKIESRLGAIEKKLKIKTTGGGGTPGLKQLPTSAESADEPEAQAAGDELTQLVRSRIDAFVRAELARLDQIRLDSQMQAQKALLEALKERFDALNNKGK
jgi:hypothetical protein